MSVLSHILNHKIVAILRGFKVEDTLDIAEALRLGGVHSVEVTLNSPDALKSISALRSKFNSDMQIGAGTVLTAEQARKAIDAGAAFIISPTLDFETIETTKGLGAVSMPGAFSPTEILQAHHAGADIVKVFPSILGPQYIKDVRGPLDHIRLMPTGGVTVENIPAYLKSGAVAFGIGGGLLKSDRRSEDRLTDITQNARNFVNALKN